MDLQPHLPSQNPEKADLLGPLWESMGKYGNLTINPKGSKSCP